MRFGVPAIEGVIDRRVLINFRVEPGYIQAVLPARLRPQLVNGYAIGRPPCRGGHRGGRAVHVQGHDRGIGRPPSQQFNVDIREPCLVHRTGRRPRGRHRV